MRLDELCCSACEAPLLVGLRIDTHAGAIRVCDRCCPLIWRFVRMPRPVPLPGAYGFETEAE